MCNRPLLRRSSASVSLVRGIIKAVPHLNNGSARGAVMKNTINAYRPTKTAYYISFKHYKDGMWVFHSISIRTEYRKWYKNRHKVYSAIDCNQIFSWSRYLCFTCGCIASTIQSMLLLLIVYYSILRNPSTFFSFIPGSALSKHALQQKSVINCLISKRGYK
jgi:hypothetical protein